MPESVFTLQTFPESQQLRSIKWKQNNTSYEIWVSILDSIEPQIVLPHCVTICEQILREVYTEAHRATSLFKIFKRTLSLPLSTEFFLLNILINLGNHILFRSVVKNIISFKAHFLTGNHDFHFSKRIYTSKNANFKTAAAILLEVVPHPYLGGDIVAAGNFFKKPFQVEGGAGDWF